MTWCSQSKWCAHLNFLRIKSNGNRTWKLRRSRYAQELPKKLYIEFIEVGYGEAIWGEYSENRRCVIRRLLSININSICKWKMHTICSWRTIANATTHPDDSPQPMSKELAILRRYKSLTFFTVTSSSIFYLNAIQYVHQVTHFLSTQKVKAHGRCPSRVCSDSFSNFWASSLLLHKKEGRSNQFSEN